MKTTAKLPFNPRCMVTGAGGGLGRAICLELASRGARLFVADLHLDLAQETCRLALDCGAQSAQPVHCDVSRPEQLDAAALLVRSAVGGIDLLVNNAGVVVAGEFLEISRENWDWLMSINLEGVVSGCRAFMPMMREQGSGRVLNIASAAGFVNPPGMVPYNVSKAGVISLTESLKNEYSQYGLHFTVVCPTYFPTQINQSGRMPEESRKMGDYMFQKARATAAGVAKKCIQDLETGHFYSLPMGDAKLVFRVRNWFPALFQKIVLSESNRLFRRLNR